MEKAWRKVAVYRRYLRNTAKLLPIFPLANAVFEALGLKLG